ncbi:hypothetical protein BGX31_001526 [Mortierella sp. GBA43]|nr:hypothetical protein BGX31_001526 [Mortierella sp. GBA43]
MSPVSPVTPVTPMSSMHMSPMDQLMHPMMHLEHHHLKCHPMQGPAPHMQSPHSPVHTHYIKQEEFEHYPGQFQARHTLQPQEFGPSYQHFLNQFGPHPPSALPVEAAAFYPQYY